MNRSSTWLGKATLTGLSTSTWTGMKFARSPQKVERIQRPTTGHPTILARKFRTGQKVVMILICQMGRPIVN